jgi:hypothetical protein
LSRRRGLTRKERADSFASALRLTGADTGPV